MYDLVKNLTQKSKQLKINVEDPKEQTLIYCINPKSINQSTSNVEDDEDDFEEEFSPGLILDFIRENSIVEKICSEIGDGSQDHLSGQEDGRNYYDRQEGERDDSLAMWRKEEE